MQVSHRDLGSNAVAMANLVTPAPPTMHPFAVSSAAQAKPAIDAPPPPVGFPNASGGQIAFSGASKVVAVSTDFDGDGVSDFAFVLSPTVQGGNTLCLSFGTGSTAAGTGAVARAASSFDRADIYSAVGYSAFGESTGCTSFPVLGSAQPRFSFAAAAAFQNGALPGLIVEDSANGTLYLLAVTGAGSAATPLGVQVKSTISIPAADGAGPIYTGDFNSDGKMDFVINGQSSHSASVYLGNGDGTFQAPVRYGFDHNVVSMLLGNADRDKQADMVVLGEDGAIETFHGNADGSFATSSEGRVEGGSDGAVIGPTALADIDQDGCADLVGLDRSAGVGASGASELQVWFGHCDGTFSQPSTFPLGRRYTLAAVADLDGDGLPDVALSDGSLVSVLYHQGTRSFAAEQAVFAAPDIASIALADLNGDGVPDLFVANGLASLSQPAGARATVDAASESKPASNQAIPGGVTVLLNTRGHAAKPLAAAATTTTIYLCVGPSALCPSTGYVMPPFSSTLSMTYGQTYNGTALVTASDFGALPGNILFYDMYNGVQTLLCTLVASSAASCPPSVGTGAQVGIHVFTGVYVPGTLDTTHAGSTSSPVVLTVAPDSTTASVVGSPNPSPQGKPVTFTATVTGTNAPSAAFPGLYVPPSGNVIFLDRTTVIGTATLVPGASGVSSTATFTTTTLPVGTDPITVTYVGDQDFSGSSSAIFNETITPVLATTTTIRSSLNPSYVSQSVTFTATVALVSGAPPPVPTGTVTFFDGSTAIGTGTLNSSGIAVFTTSTLAAGIHNITAAASGDFATGSSTSSVLVQVVLALPLPGSVNFKITVTPNPVLLGVGNGIQLSVTVTELSGIPESVALSCGVLPTEAGCLFLNATIPAGGGTTTLLLTTVAPHSCGSAQPYFLGRGADPTGFAPLALPALAGLAAIFIPGRRRSLKALIAMAAFAAAMQIAGCGHCTDLGTRPGSYTIQVTGNASFLGTTEVEAQPVALTVAI
jgi:Bacterial Ig-like domain (group 3)/FG-GAP-like repeat